MNTHRSKPGGWLFRQMQKPECKHKPGKQLPYVEDHLDAERRLKNGERQVVCPVCLKCVWESDLNP